MAGFKNSSLNIDAKVVMFQNIVDGLIECCSLMNKTLLNNGEKIPNLEEKIRTHLFANYLENDEVKKMTALSTIGLRFEAEAQENYDKDNESYKGRVDIKVYSNDIFNDNKAYYIIECKRIDGSLDLNKKYIDQGVKRFVDGKYSSYNGRNIMLGFVVKDINIEDNTIIIDNQNKLQLSQFINIGFSAIRMNINEYALYSSNYRLESTKILLNHIFYNFSNIIA